jgi:hypothetical protein
MFDVTNMISVTKTLAYIYVPHGLFSLIEIIMLTNF